MPAMPRLSYERRSRHADLAIGEDPVSAMRQLGHTDPAFTLRVYAHSMGGGPDERQRLRDLTSGREAIGEAARHWIRRGATLATRRPFYLKPQSNEPEAVKRRGNRTVR